MKGIYRFADTNIEIETEYDFLHKKCIDYRTDGSAEIIICVRQSDIEYIKKRTREYNELKGISFLEQSDAYYEFVAAYELIAERLIQRNILLFHGSVLSMDKEGYMFTAPSGTGKSTHARLWRECFSHRVEMINDDKPLLAFREDGIYAYGTPWCGKHNLGSNSCVRLKAIAVLERADSNDVCRLSFDEAIPVFFTQGYRPGSKAGMQKALMLLAGMKKHIEFYRLRCNMEREAALTAYEGMN